MKCIHFAKGHFRSLMVVAALFVCCAASSNLHAQTTVFTYQGKLSDTGTPQSSYQMEFRLFGSLAGPDQIGSTISNSDVQVSGGVFTVRLNFDTQALAAFPSADRYLEISVRRSAAEAFVTLNPRQQITSSPYSIRTIKATQADVALDANKLGGVDASQYVTTASVGNTFIKNSSAPQTGDFNISGNGLVGGNVGIGTTTPQAKLSVRTGSGLYGITHSDGSITVGSYVGNSTSGATGGWFGTQSNNKLFLFTNNGQPSLTVDTTSNVGIGTTTPTSRLEIVAQDGLAVTGFQPFMTLRDTNNTNKRSVLQGADGGFIFYPNSFIGGNPAMVLRDTGNVGLGTPSPNTRLSLNGGAPWTTAGWTASMNMQNGSALGWEANAAGVRYGIGQTNGGMYFLSTPAAFGTTALNPSYQMRITDNGNIIQPATGNGLLKAAALVRRTLGGCSGSACGSITYTVINCYSSVIDSSGSGGCGFSFSNLFSNQVDMDFGFQISNRFVSLTPGIGQTSALVANYPTPNRVSVRVDGASLSNGTSDFYIFIY